MTAPTQHTRNAFIGSPIERLEDLRFLTGRGQYVDDLTLDGVLHAAILRSSVAHGRIRSIDTAAARARPGVRAVITAADIGAVPIIPLRQEPLPQLKRYEQPVIAHRKVRYVGEPIAVVVADSAALAEDALEAIAVDIEPLPAVADRAAAREGEVLLFEEIGTNLANTMTAVRGDADAAFESAPYVRREHFSMQRHSAVPMEPRGLLAEWDAGQAADGCARRRQGPVPQPAHPGGDDGPARNVGAHAGIRRRRRLRRARRILSGGLSDSVRGAAARPSGQVDRGSARKSDGDQPRARCRMRAGDRLHARRHHPRPCAAAPPSISAPICALSAAPARATSFR